MRIPFIVFAAVSALACIGASCAVNRVLFNESVQQEGLMARVVVLESGEMNELVMTIQESGGPIRESVFRINWMPDHFEIKDYNRDSMTDFLVVSTSGENHFFYGTAAGFMDI